MKKCVKCHELYSDSLTTCPICEERLERCSHSLDEEITMKRVLKKLNKKSDTKITENEVYSQMQSAKSLGKTLMSIAIILDLVSLFLIGKKAFIPVITISAVIFTAGFFIHLSNK